MPHDQVEELAPKLLPDRAAAIVVYCANGPCQNSGIAAHRLTTLGYTNVRDYHDGKQDWLDGRPARRTRLTHGPFRALLIRGGRANQKHCGTRTHNARWSANRTG